MLTDLTIQIVCNFDLDLTIATVIHLLLFMQQIVITIVIVKPYRIQTNCLTKESYKISIIKQTFFYKTQYFFPYILYKLVVEKSTNNFNSIKTFKI